MNTTKLLWPIESVFVTQSFGENPVYYLRYGMKGHNGLDLRTKWPSSPLGHAEIRSAWTGKIEEVRYDRNGYGTHIRQRLFDGGLLIYGHLKSVCVAVGDVVKAGQKIAISDNTGDSTGPHLHFEYRPAGWEKVSNGYAGAVDPLPFMVKDLYDAGMMQRCAGRLLLQVEEHGELWYVTLDGRRVSIGRDADSINAFLDGVKSGKIPALGITDADISKIPLI